MELFGGHPRKESVCVFGEGDGGQMHELCVSVLECSKSPLSSNALLIRIHKSKQFPSVRTEGEWRCLEQLGNISYSYVVCARVFFYLLYTCRLRCECDEMDTQTPHHRESCSNTLCNHFIGHPTHTHVSTVTHSSRKVRTFDRRCSTTSRPN
jgi:hypothetical protein